MPAEPSPEDFESLKWTVQFLSKRFRAFSSSEVQRLTDASFGSTLSTLLECDHELMKLTSIEDDDWFFCRTTLARWLVYVNLRLSRMKIAQLTGQEWKRLLRTVRVECSYGAFRTAILKFGSSNCLVYGSEIGCRVVFPLAAVLSDSLYCDIDGIELQRVLSLNAHPDGQQVPIERVVDSFLDSNWEERIVDIVKRREGLIGGPKQTLSEVGLVYGLSRERIRQFERRFWNSIGQKGTSPKTKSRSICKRAKELFRIFLEDFLAQGCSMVWKPSDRGFAHRMFLAKCLGITTHRFTGIDVAVIGPAATTLAGLQTKPFSFGLETDTQNILQCLGPWALSQEIASEQGCGLIDRDVTAIAEATTTWRINHLTKAQRVYLTLYRLGRPAHYSEITESYNTMYPGDISSRRNIHAILGRYELGIVWVGRKGTFALAEWGFSRPEKSLHDTVTEIANKEYRKTRQPVPISVIHEKLKVVRGPINLNSLVFATEANEDLRCVLGDAFVPSSLLDYRFSTEFPHPKMRLNEIWSEQAVDLLAVSSLAGFEFSGKHQRSVIEIGERKSILELKELIHRGYGSPELAQIFDTKTRVNQADRAISRFQALASSWVNGEKRDSRATWVLKAESVPTGFSQQELLEMIEYPYRTLIGGIPLSNIHRLQELCTTIEAQDEITKHDYERTEDAVALGSQILEIRRILREVDWRQHFYDLDIWLPLLSLELIQKLKSMKSETFGMFHRALIRANRQVGLSDSLMPWTREFPTELASLPIHWLYQFDPNSRFLRILTALSSAHCTNVGHLVALHPVSVDSIRRFDHKFWTRLTIMLQNHS